METRIIKKNDLDYPKRFSRLPGPPLHLHIRGQLADIPLVGVVGSRNADPRSLRFTENIAMTLSQRGFGIVSGGAAGIDTAAHRGALSAGGYTIAIIGSGFDFLYPPENKRLFEEIASQGALITEFEPAVPPSRWTFPRRNRLVAAMSVALVVVQASGRSGALITARIARSIGVPVGAVPGYPGEERNSGCLQLIRGGAALIENVDDILNMAYMDNFQTQLNLHGLINKGKESSTFVPPNMPEDELEIWNRLGTDPVHVDDLVVSTGLDATQTAVALLNLELSGLIQDSGGKHFVRAK